MDCYLSKNLIVITSGISLLMGVYMLFLFKSTPPGKSKGTAYWGIASLIIGIALFLKIMPSSSLVVSTILSPILVTIGLYLYLAGILFFKEKKIDKRVIVGIPLLDLLQITVFQSLISQPSLSQFIHFSLVLVYCILAIYELSYLNEEQKYLQSLFRVNAVSYLIFSILISLKLISLLFHNNQLPNYLNHLSVVLFTIANFLMVALTFGFLTAINLRQNKELNNQINSKNKFFSIIAHDLTGSMGTIMNFLNLINSDLEFNEQEKKKYMRDLESLSQSSFLLLQNLLKWATSSKSTLASKNEIFDLNQLIQNNLDFFTSLTRFKSITLNFDQGGQATIQGNSKMVETIVRNLISNATKFTPAKGQITISTKQAKNKRVRLQVKDNGIGIPPEKLKDITKFEKNKSTPGTEGETGSGLGLALCNELVKDHEGTIHIESELNKGTAVIIEFPAA